MTHINVTHNGVTVLALLFRSERAPYVVVDDAGAREVPWREGTSTRSAKRNELLRILASHTLAPAVEFLWIQVVKTSQKLSFDAHFYVEPAGGPVSFPLHRCRITVRYENFSYDLEWAPTWARVARQAQTRDTATIQVPALMWLHHLTAFPESSVVPEMPMTVELRLAYVGGVHPLVHTAELQYFRDQVLTDARWSIGQSAGDRLPL